MKPEMEKLVEDWLEGSIDADKQRELTAWLKEHPERMQEFVEANMREQMLRDAAEGVYAAEDVRELTATSEKPSRRPAFRFAAFAAGLAACLLVAFIGYQKLTSPAQQLTKIAAEETEPFSSVVLVQENAGELKVGDRLGNETIRIDRGTVRLLFDDGVEVTLQGPASYELVAIGKTRLHSGLLTATVPPGAEGFRVDTPTAQVVDLGTAFGIDLRPDGSSEVSVFDGEIEVTSQKDRGKRLLVEGETIQFAEDGSLHEAEFSTQPFEKLWPAASGIAGSTGAFQFAPQWPRRLSRVESDTKIFVLPEGYPTTLDQSCSVDMTQDTLGEFQIPAGQRVRSFLLQFNPIDSASRKQSGNRRNGRRIEGSITFDRPVLGLITRTKTLSETDELFSLPRARGLIGRGLEERPPRLADKVSLSEDRRTLKLDLFVVDRLSDHVRVIIDAELSEPKANVIKGQ